MATLGEPARGANAIRLLVSQHARVGMGGVMEDATVGRGPLDARASRTCEGRIIADPEAQINIRASTSGLSLRHRIED